MHLKYSKYYNINYIVSVTVLLEHGADMHITNAKGESALSVSAKFPVFHV